LDGFSFGIGSAASALGPDKAFGVRIKAHSQGDAPLSQKSLNVSNEKSYDVEIYARGIREGYQRGLACFDAEHIYDEKYSQASRGFADGYLYGYADAASDLEFDYHIHHRTGQSDDENSYRDSGSQSTGETDLPGLATAKGQNSLKLSEYVKGLQEGYAKGYAKEVGKPSSSSSSREDMLPEMTMSSEDEVDLLADSSDDEIDLRD